jgi:hypothetical protein
VWSSGSPRLRAAEMKISSWAHLFLADVFVQLLGPQGALDGLLVGRAGVAEMMRCSEKSSVWMLML